MSKRKQIFLLAAILVLVIALWGGGVMLLKSDISFVKEVRHEIEIPSAFVGTVEIDKGETSVKVSDASDTSKIHRYFINSVTSLCLPEIPSCGFEETKSLVVTVDKGTDAEANFIMASDGCPVFYHKETQTCFGLAHEHIEPFNEILTENGISFEIQKP